MTRFGIFTMVVVAAGICIPARAERPCSITYSMPATAAVKAAATATMAVAGKGDAPFAKGTQALVSGSGKGVLTDPDGEKFFHQFLIAAEVKNDGSARGKARFVFPMPFSQKWGAVPGVDLIHLEGEITGGWVDEHGKVSLTGPFVERDYSRGEGLVYEEDSRDSGSTPMAIEVAAGSREFTFSWCDFIPPDGKGHFSFRVTNGNLTVQAFSGKTRGYPGHRR